MKQGDKIQINLVGDRKIITECLLISNGKCYLGTPYKVILSGIIWELIHDETITLLLLVKNKLL